jgi:hypothetical protein
VFVSQPSVLSALQLAAGAMHLSIWQAPRTQIASAFVNEQTLPHEPQFDGSLCVFTSQPVEAM